MLKRDRPNAPVADPWPWWQRYVTRSSLKVLPIRVSHVDRLNTLAAIHRDPFDRMLVAQALAEEGTIVTADSTLFRYGVPAVWE